jgi:hypothetical protein
MCATDPSAPRARTSTCAPYSSFSFPLPLGFKVAIPLATPRKTKGHAVPVDGLGANKPPLHAAIATAGTAHGGWWHAWVKRCEHPRGGSGGKACAPARASRVNNVSIILATI